jgi:23S rRNA pseudouridine1911/1915/1917 synthase
VWGTLVPSNGSIDAPIGRSNRDRKKMAVMGKGKPALTHYKVIEEFGIVSLIECKLATGRTHQIRVHLAHIKHPVVGDKAYGGGRCNKKSQEILQQFPRQALHAVGLQFIHPRTGKLKKFSSKLPADMRKLLLFCGKHL